MKVNAHLLHEGREGGRVRTREGEVGEEIRSVGLVSEEGRALREKVPDTFHIPSAWIRGGTGTILRRPDRGVYRATRAAVPTARWEFQRG